MLAKSAAIGMGLLLLTTPALAQAPAESTAPRSREDSRWRTADRGDDASRSDAGSARAPGEPLEPLRPITNPPRSTVARVTKGTGALPNEHGQVWREYDITPYTRRVTTTGRSEQAIVDWILRETGYEAWHSEPVALLSATSNVLRVYHTPEMQAVVAELIDRFISTQAETHAFGLRLITVGNPNWRAKAQPLLQPVGVQTPGTEAWILAKEDAGLLLAELRKRTDFREHSSPHLLVQNGQSTVVTGRRPRPYIRGLIMRPDAWPGFESEVSQFDEGFSLEISPLLSLDGSMIDAVVKCNVDQIEKLLPVVVEVPTVVAARQRAKIEVPQTSHARLHERFRWPTDQVLLIGMGMVASPVPSDNTTPLIPLPMGPARADLLIMVESRGQTGQPPAVTVDSQAERPSFNDRY